MINDLININGIPYAPHSGSWSNIEQVFMCHYPFLTSSNGRTDVGPTGMGAYYYQGFCCTPDGFAMVRLAPDTVSEKVVSTDISQIIEFYSDGTFKRAVGVDVHHGNGMCYYDGYLYVDVGNTVAKINYSNLTIVEQISVYGGCPAVDREHGCFYTAARSGSSYSLYRYDFASGAITQKTISSDCPDIYNGSFYKDGIFYGITYNNDFVMIDVNTGKFLGGIGTSSIDTTGIYLYELEDADCSEDGTVYVMSQQPNFTTRVFTVDGTEQRLRNVGFYIGKLYINGGASVNPNAAKPLRIHRSGIYVTSPASQTEAMAAKLQTGSSSTPFYSFAALSFLTRDVREINASSYTTLYFGDIYQPYDALNYGYIKGLKISTTYPFAIKNWKGYMEGETITITNYGVSVVFSDIDNLDLTCTKDCCMGLVQYGRAEIIQKSATYRTTMFVHACIVNGCNVIPIQLSDQTKSGGCTTYRMKYTNQAANSGSAVELYVPNIGGTRGTRIAFSNATKYVIYRRYSDTVLYGTDDSTITLTEDYTTNYILKFTAPYAISAIEVF